MKRYLWPAIWLAAGIFSFVYAFVLFDELAQLEARGGSIRLNFILLFVYEMAGKWVACGFLIAGSILAFALGAWMMIRAIKNK